MIFALCDLRLFRQQPSFGDAYKLAVKYQRTVYDSLYLALSLREGCQFVTADERFVNAIGSSFLNIIWVSNWT